MSLVDAFVIEYEIDAEQAMKDLKKLSKLLEDTNKKALDAGSAFKGMQSALNGLAGGVESAKFSNWWTKFVSSCCP